MSLPLVMTAAGAQQQTPASLRQQLTDLVAATNPGYTANLPGSLIEDIASTDTGALSIIDSAQVDLINSLTPYGANPFILNQLGQVYGVQQGIGSNTSVYVVFTGSPGYIVPRGFVVSDGLHQYTVVEGGAVATGGQTSPLYALANEPGSWAVPANSVTGFATSVPAGVTLSVTNPGAGLPGLGEQSIDDYRAQVLQAGLANAQGTPKFLKTLLGRVAGVQPRLVSVRQLVGRYEIIVGGGDPYEVAYAIYQAMFDLSNLVGSELNVTNVSAAAAALITLDKNHGYATGQVVFMSGIVGPGGLNDIALIATVVSPVAFTVPVSTLAAPPYVSGGIVSPNLRNATVSIADYPDTYLVTFVNPPQQLVGIGLTWNTNSPNYVSPLAVAQAGQPALADYVNSVPVGAPLNVFELQNAFQNAIAAIVPPQLISRMVFTVTIGGYLMVPSSGTGLIYGDPESYFETSAPAIVIVQG